MSMTSLCAGNAFPHSAAFATPPPKVQVDASLFKSSCWQRVLQASVGSGDTGHEVNKELLHAAVEKLFAVDQYEGSSSGVGNALAGIDYGFVGAAQGRSWISIPGQELVVVDPSPERAPKVTWKSLISATINLEPAISRLFVSYDLGKKARSDPFSKLPYGLLERIFDLLSDK
ncbi:hypothetical protein B0H67DRAFT_116962 [Lasiosphaeris hirsuta]|uniref:Uncharacterized protein n=1 Tax=Lasiosphaeris hirsuta TaxID=260670 RepID=A0AA40E4K7_9PEZI|nr:hypothetical protein B0H67DRAFT_116962 [Lasiosphaeris hirsuta]